MLYWVFFNAASLFFVWLFASSSTHKLKQTREESERLLADAAVPTFLKAQTIMLCLSIIEAGTAIALLIPQTREIGFAATSALCLSYMIYLQSMLNKGNTNLKCGCSGPASDMRVSRHLIYRNASLLVIALLCLSNSPKVSHENELSFSILALLLGCLFTLIYASSEQLILNSQKIDRIKKS